MPKKYLRSMPDANSEMNFDNAMFVDGSTTNVMIPFTQTYKQNYHKKYKGKKYAGQTQKELYLIYDHESMLWKIEKNQRRERNHRTHKYRRIVTLRQSKIPKKRCPIFFRRTVFFTPSQSPPQKKNTARNSQKQKTMQKKTIIIIPKCKKKRIFAKSSLKGIRLTGLYNILKMNDLYLESKSLF